jgi:hypothetical protein
MGSLVLEIAFYKNDRNEYYLFYVYYVLRWASIAVNLLFHFMINYRVALQNEHAKYSNQSSIGFAIREMARRRLLYYTRFICKAICRLPSSVYSALYYDTPFAGDASPTKFALAVLTAIFTPSTGTAYLIIFLVMQPNAYFALKAMCSCNWEEIKSIVTTSVEQQNQTGSSAARPAVYNNSPSNALPPLQTVGDDYLLDVIRDSSASFNSLSDKYSNGSSYRGSSLEPRNLIVDPLLNRNMTFHDM